MTSRHRKSRVPVDQSPIFQKTPDMSHITYCPECNNIDLGLVRIDELNRSILYCDPCHLHFAVEQKKGKDDAKKIKE
jgi:transcription elongation factor Elf1